MRKMLLTLAAVILIPNTILGQVEVRGLSLSLRAHAGSWKLDDVEGIEFSSQNGGGAGAEVFYGMSEVFGIFGRIDLSSIAPDVGDRYTLTHFDIGVRLLPMLMSRNIRPYGELAFSARSAEFPVTTSSLEVSGPGTTVGAGVLLFVNSRFAVGLGAAGTFGSMSEISLGGFSVDTDVKATSWRGSAGLVWFP